ncbi:fibrinogen-like YCDxxxxGGGW domain-containing protein [Colwellia sp. E150_009]
MNKISSLALILLCTFNSYAGQVSFLKVENDILYFSVVNSKTHLIPSCVTAENNDTWAISLSEGMGRAMYPMLMTAVAAKINVTVETKNTCDITAFESPLNLSFGTQNNAPVNSSIYASCDEILQNIPSAQDGIYTIQPGTGQLDVFCHMDVLDGGWTLVMRGAQDDIDNWNTTGALNMESSNTDQGATFKLSDDLINTLVNVAYKVVLDESSQQKIRYFKPTCVYRHEVNSNLSSDCHTSYPNMDWRYGTGDTHERGEFQFSLNSRPINYECRTVRFKTGGLSDARKFSQNNSCSNYNGSGSAFISTLATASSWSGVNITSWITGQGGHGAFNVSGYSVLEETMSNSVPSTSFNVWVK